MVCFNSFNFTRQIYWIFRVPISSLIWLKKIQVPLLSSFILILLESFYNFWRFVKQNLLKIVIARSPVYFIVLMLISYEHFYITNCTNTLCSVHVPVSVVQAIFLIKTSILVFAIVSRLPYEVRKYQNINLLAPKGSSNSDDLNILSFYLIFLLSFNFLRKQITLTCIAFLGCILYRFSKPQNRLKSCFVNFLPITLSK